MKPIVAFGHERPVTRVAINRDGDLIVSASKDSTLALWDVNSLECCGTMHHQGAILDVDILYTTIISASADFSFRMWENGKEIKQLAFEQIVRSCQYSKDGNNIIVLLEMYLKYNNELLIVDKECKKLKSVKLSSDYGKATISRWGPLCESILIGFEDGTILVLNSSDLTTKKIIKKNESAITDIQMSLDSSTFIISSKDQTATLYDYTFTVLKVYNSDRPVNSASISSKKDHVILGGGQEAYFILM